MEKIKIVMVCGPLSRSSGGVFTVVYQLANQLSKNEQIDLTIFGALDEFTHLDLAKFSNVKLEFYNKIGTKYKYFSTDFLKKLNKINPDIVHIQSIWVYYSLFAYIYAKKKNKSVIISPHGMLDEHQLNTSSIKKKIALNLFEKKNISNASRIHALNESESNSILNLSLNKKIIIIPNGIDLPVKTSSINKYERDYVLFMGRINPKKNISTLILAWQKIQPIYPDIDLIIAGDYDEKPEYTQELKKLIGSNNHIKLVGGVYEAKKNELLKNCKLFILPSYSEGSPMAVLEAWSHSKPCLISDECNLSFSFDMKASIFCGTKEEEIFKALNLSLNMNLKELLEIGKNALELVEKNFTWDLIAEKYLDMYTDIKNS